MADCKWKSLKKRTSKRLSSVWEQLCRWWREDRPPWVIIVPGTLFGIPGFFGSLATIYFWFNKQWPNHLNIWWPDLTKGVEEFHEAFGDFPALFCLALSTILWLHNRLLRLNQKLADQLGEATRALERTTLPTLHNDLFAGLFAYWGNGFATGDHFNVFANGPKTYISIHSEVLYYTMLCSLLDSLGDSVTAISRVHIFIPGGASALFLPEILRVLPEAAVQNRYYIFRNDLLDYDRESLRGKGDESQMHLWSVFAAASRILLRDSGARFGYFKAYSESRVSIWHDRFYWREGYKGTCERLRIDRESDLPAITAIVERNQTTFEFKQARIIVGDETAAIRETAWPPTDEYFTTLKRHEGASAWTQANEWESYPLEVALVSGTEMELHARPGVTLWAVDHFLLDNFGESPGEEWQEMEWLKEGSPRYLAWTKSIAASQKQAKIYRLFLIDASLLTGRGDQELAKLRSLFSTMAIQYKYLSELERDTSRGEVRFLVKQASVKIENEYPDYLILADDGQIHGGVVWKPQPRYVGPDDGALLTHLQSLWNRAQRFPAGFLPVKTQLLDAKTAIATAIARVEQLNDRSIPPHVAPVESWLTEILK